MDDDVHRSYPPPAAGDRVDGDLDEDLGVGRAAGPDGERSETRFAPPAADQRVELTRSYLPWVVLITLLSVAAAVYFLL